MAAREEVTLNCGSGFALASELLGVRCEVGSLSRSLAAGFCESCHLCCCLIVAAFAFLGFGMFPQFDLRKHLRFVSR